MIVTGAASGIGRATAETASAVGLRVALWDIDEPAVRQVAASAETEHVAVVCDVTDVAAVRRALDATSEALGHTSYLVSNAGPSSFIERTFHDGLASAAGSMFTVVDEWIAAGRREGDAVVCTSSVAGTSTGGGDAPWYPAAKAAIAGYVRFLGLNRPGGIRANAVAPGLTATPRVRDFVESPAGKALAERIPMGRLATAEDIAAAILFLLSPAASYVNGVVLAVDGGSLLTM